jgi:RNA polymerase sigma-70 factor, ECF subfamily
MATVTVLNQDKIRTARLVVAAQGGDREAFGALFERFERHVFAIALRRLGNFCEAQELCQDVFVQAIQKLDQLRAPESFGAWIASITNRMAINRAVRRKTARAAEPGVLEAVRADERTPLTDMLAGERHKRVRDGLARLRKLDRQTLKAFYVEGRSLKEMSVVFKAPVGTIKRRLHVARQRLAKEVEPWMAV